MKKVQPHQKVALGIAVFHRAPQGGLAHAYAQFLGQLSPQGLIRPFRAFHLTAGKLPVARHGLAVRPLRRQKRPAAPDNARRHFNMPHAFPPWQEGIREGRGTFVNKSCNFPTPPAFHKTLFSAVTPRGPTPMRCPTTPQQSRKGFPRGRALGPPEAAPPHSAALLSSPQRTRVSCRDSSRAVISSRSCSLRCLCASKARSSSLERLWSA